LNSGRSRETLSLDFAHNICREASLVECLDWSWDVSALDSDTVLLSELQDIGLGAVGNEWILLVERLLEFGEVT
jgi:hypothetical protein